MIDIVIPHYGESSLLKLAVESVLAQTSGAWTLHVVDDNSPATGLDAWFDAIEDQRITYHRHAGRTGINAQFNQALRTGTGTHVVIMGNDDLLHPAYVARLEALLLRFPDAAVVQPGVEVIDDKGDRVRPVGDRVKARLRPSGPLPRALAGEELIASLLRGNWAYFPSLCWRRVDAAELGFPPEFEVVLDLALLVGVLSAGGEMVVDSDVTFSYRRHNASLSSVQAFDGRRFVEERNFFAQAARELAASDMPTAARAARRHTTSRLHAALLLPKAVGRRDSAAAKELIRHVCR